MTHVEWLELTARLPASPTKQQEIDYWRSFVAALPQESYLYAMFAHSPDKLENMIRNDFGYDPLPELADRQQEASIQLLATQEQHKALTKRIAELEKQKRELERQAEQFQQSLREIRTEARRIYGS